MIGSRFAGARVEESVPLAPLTTLRVGPVARRVITCATGDQVVAVLRQLDAEVRAENSEPVLVFAGGSNVVIGDTVADLTVVRLANTGITVDGNLVRAEAGAVWDDVVLTAIDHGLGGLECLSGIPGSAGATPVQNVGAYGVEVSDVISRVRLLDRSSGQVHWVPAATLGFGYRTSVLKQADGLRLPAVVLEVEFALDASGRSAPLRYDELTAALGAASGERADPQTVRAAVLALRARKGMVLDATDHDTWSAGSFSPIRWSHRTSTNGWRRRWTARCRTIRRLAVSSWPRAGWSSTPASARAIRIRPSPGRPPRAGCPPSTRWR
ncbi:hypothetical protein NIIDMKKI_66630 [Mycobacterium kansasii]|uniref:UDP-N-acetylenolpyruvoylglucosamine reductase n=1 Tax=Mycobacterium kansasii TaxID=1768 RepID=A0A7G1IL07_MYCKA|nr:hypothetical protein NIIDMKKI_66630 [Mycobacterium kansasii]